jgi:hypothetical protein
LKAVWLQQAVEQGLRLYGATGLEKTFPHKTTCNKEGSKVWDEDGSTAILAVYCGRRG